MRWLIPTLVFTLAGRVSGEDLSLGFGWRNLEFRTYTSDSMQEIADCKVEKIFLDHRKLGFFRVKLLPVLVVQGVRLEFAGVNPTNEWMETFQSDWLPKVKRSAVEWRDVNISSQKAGAPQLHAGGAQPAVGTPTVCMFKDVTRGGQRREMADAAGGVAQRGWPSARGLESRWWRTAPGFVQRGTF